MSSLRPTARVARGATYLFVQGLATTFVNLIYFIILARQLTQAEMGVYALLTFLLALAQVLGTFALPSAAVKYIAQHLAENNSEKAKSVVARVVQICLLSALVALILFVVGAEWLSTVIFSTTEYTLLLRLVGLCATFQILYMPAVAFLQGQQKIRDMAVLTLIYTAIQNSLGIYLLYIGWGLYAVVYSWLAGLVFVSVGGLLLTAKYLGLVGKPYPAKPLLRFSYPLYISAIFSYVASWVDQLMLVSYLSLLYGAASAQEILGVYYVAVRASLVPTLFSAAIVTALFPQLSALYTQKGSNSLKDAFRVSTRYSILIGFPLIVGIAVLAYPIIILLAGSQYVDATLPLIVISIAALVGAIGIAISPILLTLERTLIASVLNVIVVAITLILSYFGLVVLGLGVMGTAWARTFSAIISFGLFLYTLSRYIPVSIDKEALWKTLASSAFMVFSIFALDAVRLFLSPNSSQLLVLQLHLLPIYVIIGGLAYLVSLYGLKAVKKNDVELVYDYLPKRLRWLAGLLERIAVSD